MKFPSFSESKLFTLKPDIVDVPVEMNKPVYDLIIGVESMSNGRAYGFCRNANYHRSRVTANVDLEKPLGLQSTK